MHRIRPWAAAAALAVAAGCLAEDEVFDDDDLATEQQESTTAPSSSNLVTLYTWYSPSRNDYFTTSHPSWQGAPGQTRSPDYMFVRTEGRAWRPDLAQPPDTIALHGWWHPTRRDNFIIAGTAHDSWIRSMGFVHVRVEGYVATKPLAGTVRLRSYYGPDEAATADPLWESSHTAWRTEGHLFQPGSWQAGQTPAPELFGYKRNEASGNRPLLLIYRHLRTPSAGADASNTLAFYDQFVFGPGARTIPGYFTASSHGKFTFYRAGAVEITDSSTAPTDARAIELAGAAGFNFNTYDRNGDGTVTTDELAILVISQDGVTCAQSRGVACTRPPGSTVNVCPYASFVGGLGNFSTIAHELAHHLGLLDLYGPGAAWNTRATLAAGTCAAGNDTNSYHLDPWHKMAFGWIEPRIVSMREPGAVETLYAPGAWGTYAYYGKRPVLLFDPQRTTNEFFLLEFRRRDGSYDAQVSDNGVAIWHVRLDDSLRPADVRWNADSDPELEHRLANNVYMAPGGTLGPGWGQFWDATHGDVPLRWENGSSSGVVVRVGAFTSSQLTVPVQIGSDGSFRARIDASLPMTGYRGTTMNVYGVFGLPGARTAYLRRGGVDTALAATRWDAEGLLQVTVPSTLATGSYDLVIKRPGSSVTSNVVPVTVQNYVEGPF